MIAIIVAGISVTGALIGHLYSRLNRLEDELKGARAYNMILWEWARNLIDLYYRYRKDGAPDPDPIPKEK